MTPDNRPYILAVPGPCKVVAAEATASSITAAAVTSRVDPAAPLSSADVHEVTAALERQGATARRAIVAVPAADLRSIELETPKPRPGLDLAPIVHAEAARLLGKTPNDIATRWFPIPAPPRASGASALAVAFDHDAAESLIQAFARAGITVDAIVPLTMLPPPPGKPDALALHLTWNTARLTLHHDGAPVFERSLPKASPSHVMPATQTAAAAEALRADLMPITRGTPSRDPAAVSVASSLAEDLIEGITQCLTYTRRRFPEAEPTDLLLSGEAADAPGLSRLLAEGTGLRVSKPADNQQSPAPNADAPEPLSFLPRGDVASLAAIARVLTPSASNPSQSAAA